jgi:YggT family protein
MGALFSIIGLILTIFELVLLARVLLSWLPDVDRSNPIVRFLYDVTEPVLAPIRQMMPAGSMIDFSPLIVFLVIRVFRMMLGI